jgi:hypothetical protein
MRAANASDPLMWAKELVRLTDKAGEPSDRAPEGVGTWG